MRVTVPVASEAAVSAIASGVGHLPVIASRAGNAAGDAALQNDDRRVQAGWEQVLDATVGKDWRNGAAPVAAPSQGNVSALPSSFEKGASHESWNRNQCVLWAAFCRCIR